MEELGTKIKLGDHDVWAHHAWINKVLRLAAKAGVAKTTTYIEQVRRELPALLRTKVTKVHADWAAFAKAIWDVDTGDLEQEMKEKKDKKEERDKLAKLVEQRTRLQASPTAGIRAQLNNVRIGPPAQGPMRWLQAAAGANPFQSAGGGGQGNLFAAPRARSTRSRRPAHSTSPKSRAHHTSRRQCSSRWQATITGPCSTPLCALCTTPTLKRDAGLTVTSSRRGSKPTGTSRSPSTDPTHYAPGARLLIRASASAVATVTTPTTSGDASTAGSVPQHVRAAMAPDCDAGTTGATGGSADGSICFMGHRRLRAAIWRQ
jgi:hypothetical protein